MIVFFFLLIGGFPLYADNTGSVVATVSISICGNNIIEGGEVCDSSSLDNVSCSDYGYEYGEVHCGISCHEFDISNCSDSNIEEVEEEIVKKEGPIEKEETKEKKKERRNPLEVNISQPNDINKIDESGVDLFVEDEINLRGEMLVYDTSIARAPP
ncbi:MAG: hypothetical protein PHE21_02845 [Candidatus Dojkabacteria bacterium]|nr:hypothetical protein [Candidatus Dojkabacteria bacterium]